MNESEKAKKIQNNEGRVYVINGVKVPFPAKAYPQQITMMNKILKGLDKKQNCLLESPTGSGKTLSLLCSCLGWQRSEKERVKAIQKAEENCRKQPSIYQLNTMENYDGSNNTVQESKQSLKMNIVEAMKSSRGNESIAENDSSLQQSRCAADDAQNDNSDDMDFQSAKKRFRTPTGSLPSAKRPKKCTDTRNKDFDSEGGLEAPPQLPTWRMEVNSNTEKILSVEEKLHCKGKDQNSLEVGSPVKDLSAKEILRVPKIFYGTRTHKQITQIVRELKKTDFNKTRMTILSSREHSCIHPQVSVGRDKNEECRRHVKGLDGKCCRYYSNTSMLLKPGYLEKYKLHESWDIEDLVKAGKKAKACPYYTAREMIDEADIIFCPYNYLVDPFIRSQMDINVKGEIVILDEAHNIEDSARDAASVCVTSVELEDVVFELDLLIRCNVMTAEHGSMRELSSIILNWLESLSDVLTPTGYETSFKILTGTEMIERLRLINITSSTLLKYKEMLSEINDAEVEANGLSDKDAAMLSTKGTTVLRILVTALGNVLEKRTGFNDDFKIAIFKKAGIAKRPEKGAGVWRNSRAASLKAWVYSLNFWCLNPAVVFSELDNKTRCIVLTSGTLSPMNSFSSELGAKFPIQLEANHVVPDSQVWVGALTVDTENQKLRANYHSSETFLFQDEVGKVVLQICQTIPRGVLCFFPSYSMLEKLKKRWQNTDIWEKISSVKTIFSEPRGSDRMEFDSILEGFYGLAKDESETGALLLAVCRGKISEGLDFSDNNARAVITIGIPFPDFKDKQVELKREYNNKYSNSRGLLTGSQWYEIQAYRALNQALGRCIRHRRDWGAIILLDERFGQGKYREGLSRWVRSRCKIFSDFAMCFSALKNFADERTINPCPEELDCSRLTELQTPSCFSPEKRITEIDKFSSHGRRPEKSNSILEKDVIKEATSTYRNSSTSTSDVLRINVERDGSETPILKKEKFISKNLCSPKASEANIPDQKGKASCSDSTIVEPKVYSRMRLFNTAQSELKASSNKAYNDRISEPKTANRIFDAIVFEDDELVDALCRNTDDIDQLSQDSFKPHELFGKKNLRSDTNHVGKSNSNTDSNKGYREESPLLFSDNTADAGNIEDQFWECSDLEMKEFVSSKLDVEERNQPESRDTINVEAAEFNKDRKLQEGEGKRLETHAVVERRGMEQYSLTFMNEKDRVQNRERNENSVFGVRKNKEYITYAKSTKSNIRMTAKTNPISCTDSKSLSSRSSHATIKCTHCQTHFSDRVRFSCKRIDASSAPELLNIPDGEVVDLVETAFSSLRNCQSIGNLCSCGSKTSDLKLNSFFSEENSTLYVPLVCVHCYRKSQKQELVGFRTIPLRHVSSPPKEQIVEKGMTLLFLDQLIMDNYRAMDNL